MTSTDPLELIIARALSDAGISFTHESDNKVQRLDFYIPASDVYIEVKTYHTLRTIDQLASQDNVIVLQGVKAVKLFAKLITHNSLCPT